MSLLPPPRVQADKTEGLSAAIQASQQAKAPEQGQLRAGKRQKPLIEDETEMAGQADGASADEALAAATDTPDTGTAGGNIHLAQAPGPVTDAPPPAAGSVPAGAPVAGAAVVGGGIPTGLLIAGGVIGVAAAAGAAAGGDSTPADTTAPTVTTVAITSATGLLNSTLNAGDVVSVTVTLSEATTVTGTPQLALNIGGATVQANYAAGSGTTALVFTYTILAGDDANGIGINANSLTLNGGTLRDAAGNNATLTHALVADNAGYKVDTTAPTVTISDDEAGTANLAGGDVTYTFQFNEAVTGFDATDVAVVNGVKGTFTAVDADTYTLAVTPNASLEGNLTVDVAAGAAADTAGNNSTAAAQSVQAVDTRAPTVTSVTIANGPYSLGETVTVTVLFNEAVTVAGGTPTLALDIGGTAKQAAFTGGSGTNTLTFSYVVEAGLTDTDGIDATANGITLGAATIRDAAGNPATLTYGLAINAPATVDTTAPTAPAAPTVAENAAGGINAAEAADGTPVVVNITGTGALAGDTLTVNWGGQTATYTLLAADILANSAAVTVPTGTITTQGNGTFNVSAFITDIAGNLGAVSGNTSVTVDTVAPTVTISDDEAGTANIAGGDVVYTFQFSEAVTGFDASDVTVVNGVKGAVTAVDADTYTLAVTPNANLDGLVLTVDVAGGAAADTAGNNSTAAAQSMQLVDTRAPTVTSVTIADGAYAVGETVTVSVIFSEPVTLAGGVPTLALNIGGTAKVATYASSPGSTLLTFSYVVETGLTDTDGIDATANGITLGAATIKDAAGNDATLTYALVNNAVATVDTTAPTAPAAPAAPTVAENGAGGINAAEASDGTPVVVNIAGTGALAGDTLTVNWGGQTVAYTLLAADIAGNSATVAVPTGTITTQGNGTFNVSAFITDIAGNVGATSNNTSVTVDTVAPTVTISDDEAGTANIAGGEVIYTFQFSEAVTGFDATDVTVVNGVKGAVTPVDADTYTLAVTPTAGFTGNLTVDVAAGAALDTAGNNSTAAVQSVQAVDMLAPTVTTVTIANGAYALGETVTVTVLFNEAVTVAGGTPTLELLIGATLKQAGFTGGSGTNTLTFSYVVETGLTDANGIDASSNGITLGAATIVDAAANPANLSYPMASNPAATVDTAAPTAPAAPTVAENGAGGINAAEASDGTPVVVNIAGTGALAGDTLTVNWGGQTATYTLLAADILANSAAVTVPTGTITTQGNGTFNVSAFITDIAGNLGATSNNTSVTVDTVAPTVTISDDEAGTANIAGGEVIYTFQFSEAVTGFDATDVAVVNGVKGTFTAVDADTYTLAVTPNAGFTGNLTVNVAAGAALDTAGNGSTAAAQSVQDVDTTVPTLSSSTPADNATAVVVGSNIVLTFNENVTVGVGDIVISNSTDTRTIAVGDATQVTIAGTTVTINPTADLNANTTYYVQMASGVIVDISNNPYAGIADTTTLNFDTVDTTPPTVADVAITSATGLLNSTLNVGDVVSVTVTMSEATVVVTTGGTPQLALNIGGTTVQANFATGSGTAALVFTYTILAGQTDTNGISIAANSLALNGGTMKDAAGNNATLTHGAIGDTSGYLVDTTAPTNVGATFANTANAVVTFDYSEAVTGGGGLSLTRIAAGVEPWNGTAMTLTGGGGAPGITLTVDTNTTLIDTDVVRARYDAGGGGTLADLAGNVLASREIFIGGSGNSTIDLDGYNNGNLPIMLRGNAGNDTLTGSHYNDVLIDGIGVDTLNGNHGADTLRLVENGGTLAYSRDVVQVGVAQSTVAAMDHVRGSSTAPAGTGFDISSTTVASHDVLDLFAVNIAGNVGITNGTDAGSIAQHSVTSGIVSFFDAGGNAILINSLNAADAASYLSANFTAVGVTAAFRIDTDDSGAVDSLRVFQNAVSSPLLGGTVIIPDTLIELSDLAGINSAILGTTLDTTTANMVRIKDTQAPNPVAFAVTTNGFALDFAENAFATTPGLALTMQKNGVTTMNITSVTGNGTTSLAIVTDQSILTTDWVLSKYTGTTVANGISDAAGNVVPGDDTTQLGGDAEGREGDTVIDLTLFPVAPDAATGGYGLNGYGGNDTLTGSSGVDRISGGTGADTMTSGAGKDEYGFEQGDSPLVTAMNLGAGVSNTTLDSGDTFSFANGVDRITDFARIDASNTEGFNLNKSMGELLGNAGAPGYMGSAPSDGLATDQGFFAVQGNYTNGAAGSAGTFTVNTTAAGLDTLIVWDGNSSAVVTQTAIVLSGVTFAQLSLQTGSNWISHV